MKNLALSCLVSSIVLLTSSCGKSGSTGATSASQKTDQSQVSKIIPIDDKNVVWEKTSIDNFLQIIEENPEQFKKLIFRNLFFSLEEIKNPSQFRNISIVKTNSSNRETYEIRSVSTYKEEESDLDNSTDSNEKDLLSIEFNLSNLCNVYSIDITSPLTSPSEVLEEGKGYSPQYTLGCTQGSRDSFIFFISNGDKEIAQDIEEQFNNNTATIELGDTNNDSIPDLLRIKGDFEGDQSKLTSSTVYNIIH
jgi:hypothetical protein